MTSLIHLLVPLTSCCFLLASGKHVLGILPPHQPNHHQQQQQHHQQQQLGNSRVEKMGVGDWSFDWRDKGKVSSVKDMQERGDYAVAMAGAVESLYAIATQTPVRNLSMDEVADCCRTAGKPKYPGFGCIQKLGGLCAMEDYKPAPGHYECRSGSCNVTATVNGTVYLPPGREDLMEAALKVTPLLAYVDAAHGSFSRYSYGIYVEPKCSQTDLNLAVEVVGVGTEVGRDYWLIKNSWGARWGEAGYMQLQRGTNMCGIANKVFYPTTTDGEFGLLENIPK